MKRMKRWTALVCSVLLLAEMIPVYGAQPPVDTEAVVTAGEPETEVQQTKEAAERQEENLWYDYEIDLGSYYYRLTPGQQQKLQVETDAPVAELEYESSDPSVATVSADGLITAVNGGVMGYQSVMITVKWTNPKNPENRISAYCEIEVQNTISLNRTQCTIYTGQKTVCQLSAVTKPVGAVTWNSSDPSVVTVDGTGRLTPKRAGTSIVTAAANGVSESCTVTVKKPSLSLKSRAVVYVKNPCSLHAKASPAAKIKWKSSNPKIATVNAKNQVVGKKAGKVTITAKANGITKSCKVTVKKPSIAINGSTTAVYQGSSARLYAFAKPGTARIRWKTSDKNVAKVDKDGNVTGVGAGSATITAYIPGAKAVCTVKVVKNPYKLNFTSRTLMKGNTATLYVKNLSDAAAPSFSIEDDWDSIHLTTRDQICIIKADAKGTAKVKVSFWTYTAEGMVNWSQICTIRVLDTGISDQQFSIARGTKKKLKLINAGAGDSIASVRWSSLSPKVASVNPDTGEVTGKKTGSARITAEVTNTGGGKKTYTADMKVSDPRPATLAAVVALYGKKNIRLKGVNAYSSVKWKSKKKSVVTVSPDGTLTPKKQGTAVVTAAVDGKTVSCRVYVSNPSLASDYLALAPGGVGKIQLKGLSAKSRVSCRSSNSGVASVDRDGRITAKSGGRAEITVNADGRKFYYLVEVASQAALNACREGKAIIDRSTYSQALRMTEGYYDCSSLVFRAYGRNSGLLGGSFSWAPTAAGMAEHMRNTGKVISYAPVAVESLRPGDLIFYGQQNNGRYLGIYHVSMYYGNGCRLEKPMYSYYPRSNIVMVARPLP